MRQKLLLFCLLSDTLTPAPAIAMAGTLLAITRQLLELERCSNQLRILQDL